MQAVTQLESSGCGIACAAVLANVSYTAARKAARGLGIRAADPRLWSDTAYVRTLLAHFDIETACGEKAFTSWEALPALALLSIKWRLIGDRPFWHWVVFVRDGDAAYILDSKRALKHNRRTDFWRINPHWFIEVVHKP